MTFHSIKQRIVVCVTCFLLFVLGITAISTYLYFKRYTSQLITLQQSTLVNTLTVVLDDKLQAAHNLLVVVSAHMLSRAMVIFHFVQCVAKVICHPQVQLNLPV